MCDICNDKKTKKGFICSNCVRDLLLYSAHCTFFELEKQEYIRIIKIMIRALELKSEKEE